MQTATQPTVKASELRIGNWVKIHGLPVCLSAPKLIFIIQEDGDLNTRCAGIPLTPELLQRCRFVSRPEDIIWKHNQQHFWLSVEPNEIRAQVINQDPVAVIDNIHFSTYTSVGRSIKYLHELQNLFFALTGEELNIQL